MPVGQVKERWAAYSGPNDPHFPYPRGVRVAGEKAMREYYEAHQQRMTIVTECPVCGRELIAEEVKAHRHTHLSGKARVFAREWDVLPAEVREEVLAYIHEG